MKGKVLLLIGAGVGYVLGSRAGRQRYEQIKGSAEAMWHAPAVQERVTEAEEAIKAKAPEVQERLASAASRATEKVKSTVQRHDPDDDSELGQVIGNDHRSVSE